MNFENVAESIDSDVYKRFKEALELGKWPNEQKLTKDQKEICLQAVMLYEAKNQFQENERTGYIDSSKKTSPCGTSDSDSSLESGQPEADIPIRTLH